MSDFLKKRKATGGFTLVELIVVLVILALLAAILVPALTGYIDSARERAVIAECRAAVGAAQTVYSEQYGQRNVFREMDPLPPANIVQEIKTLAEVPGAITTIHCDEKNEVHHLVYTTTDYIVTYCRYPDTCTTPGHNKTYNVSKNGRPENSQQFYYFYDAESDSYVKFETYVDTEGKLDMTGKEYASTKGMVYYASGIDGVPDGYYIFNSGSVYSNIPIDRALQKAFNENWCSVTRLNLDKPIQTYDKSMNATLKTGDVCWVSIDGAEPKMMVYTYQHEEFGYPVENSVMSWDLSQDYRTKGRWKEVPLVSPGPGEKDIWPY